MAEEPEKLENQTPDTKKEDSDLTKNRRRMAWFFVVSSAILTLIMVFYIPAASVAMYDSVYATYLFLAGSVILGYLGTSAVMTYYNGRK